MNDEPLVQRLTAAIIRGLGKLWPVPTADQASTDLYDQLTARNQWVNTVAELLCLMGVILGVALPIWAKRAVNGWDVAVLFGLATALPLLWIVAATAARGRTRRKDFWRWYSLRYGVDSTQVVRWVYVPLIALGLIGALKAY